MSILFFLTSSLCAASPENNSLNEAQQETLAHHPLWLKLLHFDKKGLKSDILSDEFFLSPHGRNDPKAELIATVESYFAPWPEDTNTHPRCRFPARFFWLSQHISLPNYTLRLPQCTRFEKWTSLDEEKSISLLLVSGYLGNPASTFGHSLLKLNRNSSYEQVDLLNLSINYGANVPEYEPTWRYVIRGLTGGYEAGFSDKYFYAQDLVYSRTEFRDMWEYELFLPDFERTLLVRHIWEVSGKKFKYFFLKQNCGFRLAELLELVIPEPLLEHARFWYVPLETFHRLLEIDAERRRTGKQGLIQSVRFIPSSRRKLSFQFFRLRPQEKHAVEAIIKQGPSSIPEQLVLFEQNRQLEILDTVLAYHKYRLVKEGASPDVERRKIKDQVLLAQLRLPPNMEARPDVPPLKSPADGNRPILVSTGINHEADEGTYLTVRWSAFSQESIGQNSLEGDELVVMDAEIGIGGNHHNVFLETFDLIRVRKYKTTSLPFDDENPWSWQVRIGAIRTEDDEKLAYDGPLRVGIGRAWALHHALSLYAITGASVHTISPHARLWPHLGILAGTGSLKSRWYAGVESMNYTGAFEAILGGQIQWKLSEQSALYFELSKGKTTKTSSELRWYW